MAYIRALSGGGGTNGLKYEWKKTNVGGTQTFTIDTSKSYLIATSFYANGGYGGISVVENGVLTHNSPAWQVTVSVSGSTLTVKDTNSSVKMDVFIFSFDGAFDANGLIS